MEKRTKIFCTLAALILVCVSVVVHYLFDPWGFYWKISEEEASLRLSLVKEAESWLGCNEADRSHEVIIDLYNAHEPLPQNYTVQYTDSWCATFASTTAIQCGLTNIVPTECSCERQIALFQELGCWEERDNIIPLPGDIIYYDWDMKKPGECTGWSDHVGIVVGTKWPFMKVIEGNRNDMVTYRVLLLNDVTIRGYGKPDYAGMLNKS